MEVLYGRKKEKMSLVDKVRKNIELYQNKNKNKQVDSDTINKARKSTKLNSI